VRMDVGLLDETRMLPVTRPSTGIARADARNPKTAADLPVPSPVERGRVRVNVIKFRSSLCYKGFRCWVRTRDDIAERCKVEEGRRGRWLNWEEKRARLARTWQ